MDIEILVAVFNILAVGCAAFGVAVTEGWL